MANETVALIQQLAKAGNITSPLQVQEAAANQLNKAAPVSGDTNTPTNVSWGKAIPELMGNTRTACYPLWASNPRCLRFSQYRHKDQLDFAVMIGHPAILKQSIILVRLWLDGVCVWDHYNSAYKPGILKLPSGDTCSFKFYDGTQEDSDPTMRRALGAPPAFTGRMYVVISNFTTRTSSEVVAKSGASGNYGYGVTQPDTKIVVSQYSKIPEVQAEMFIPELGSAPDDYQRYTLADMFLNYSLLAGYKAEEIDLERLGVGLDARGNLIAGSQTNQTQEYRDLLAQLCAVFRVDMVETELGGIRFLREVGLRTPGTDIIAGDLIQVNGEDDSTTVELDRVATNEVPATLEVSYLNSDAGCVPANVSVRRTKFPHTAVEATSSLALSVPVNMRLGQATSYSGEALFDMSANKTTFTIKLPPSYIGMEAGDIVTVQRPSGLTDLCKITQVELSPVDYTLSVVMSSINALAPTPYYQGQDTPTREAPDPAKVPRSYGTMLTASPAGDFVSVVDNVNIAGATLVSGGYPALVVASKASDFYGSTSINGVPTKLGTTANVQHFGRLVGAPLPTLFPYQTDITNKLTLKPLSGYVPTSITDEEDFHAGVNNVVVGAPGRYEMIYYRDVADNGDGTYTLSHLMRGRFSTEDYQFALQPGDFCIFGAMNGLAVVLPSDGSDVFVYGTAPGGTPSRHSGTADRVAVSANPFKTQPIIYPRAVLQGNGDIVLTWHRREYNANPDDFWADPALTFGPEQYLVEIKQVFTDVNGNVVYNPYTVNASTLRYPSVQQIVDGNKGSRSLDIRITRKTNNPAGDFTHEEIVYVE